MTIIEAVPNVSEGRRPEIINSIVDSVSAVENTRLLDHTSDPSHNRTVLTLVGNAKGLFHAMVRLYEAAIQTIDLRNHDGEHPRIGAVDVVPFIPLQQASPSDCIALARQLGETVAKRFRIPVYLYGSAASHIGRQPLENIRRGQLRGLSKRMHQSPWQPDFGPRSHHPTAGISAIGVRGPLIAFNVNLATHDIQIARDISSAIRQPTGLSYVKAIGVRLAEHGLVQVSMNLTNYQRTPIHHAFNFVKQEADKRSVRIVNSQVVGLIPAGALISTAVKNLRLTTFRPDQVLDERFCPQMAFPELPPFGEE